MAKTKISLLELDIKVRQKIKIVNFDPIDILTISGLFIETGNTIPKNKDLKVRCFDKAWDYRNWIKPLFTKDRCWNDRKLVDSRHLIGMDVADASKLYDFIHLLICALKEVPTANAENIRNKLRAYNLLINDTIKICNQ